MENVNKKKSHITGSPKWLTSKYDESYCQMAVDFLAEGGSITQLAKHIGVSRSTLHSWRSAHPNFAKAMEAGKDFSLAEWEYKLQDAVMDQSVNAQLMKFLFFIKFGITEKRDSEQEESEEQYKTISLDDLYR